MSSTRFSPVERVTLASLAARWVDQFHLARIALWCAVWCDRCDAEGPRAEHDRAAVSTALALGWRQVKRPEGPDPWLCPRCYAVHEAEAKVELYKAESTSAKRAYQHESDANLAMRRAWVNLARVLFVVSDREHTDAPINTWTSAEAAAEFLSAIEDAARAAVRQRHDVSMAFERVCDAANPDRDPLATLAETERETIARIKALRAEVDRVREMYGNDMIQQATTLARSWGTTKDEELKALRLQTEELQRIAQGLREERDGYLTTARSTREAYDAVLAERDNAVQNIHTAEQEYAAERQRGQADRARLDAYERHLCELAKITGTAAGDDTMDPGRAQLIVDTVATLRGDRDAIETLATDYRTERDRAREDLGAEQQRRQILENFLNNLRAGYRRVCPQCQGTARIGHDPCANCTTPEGMPLFEVLGFDRANPGDTRGTP